MEGKGGSFMRLAGDPNGGGKDEEKVDRGRMAHSLRSMGSAALNFAMVAQGGLDLYWWVFISI
jgi:myo-inositol-1(or 4)-monophosphatase